MQRRRLVGAIEGGGTKFICAVGDSPGAILERSTIATTDAHTTLGECMQFFQAAARRHGAIHALGIACFGPLQLRGEEPDYGSLLATPKPGWAGVDVLAPFRQSLGVPVGLDTDVGAAARAELELGAGRGQGSLAYVTVGTGVGGAVVPVHPDTRAMHAEMGHLCVRRDTRDGGFPGVCPFHGDCLEGLASGPAIRARWSRDLSDLPVEHPGRAIIAGYLGQLAAAIALLHAPQRLVIGGGVMTDGTLLPLVRESAQARLGGYLAYLRGPAAMTAFLQAPALGDDSALVGAMLMAIDALGNPAS